MTDRYGPDGSRVVLAAHGSPANRKAWLPVVPHLPPEVTMLAPDLPGHGSRGDEPFRVDVALADLARAIARERSAGARTVVVAGDSLGGYLALAAGALVPGVDAVVAGGCTFEMHGAGSALALATDVAVRLASRALGSRTVADLVGRILPRVVDAGTAAEVVRAGIRLEARSESIRALARESTGSFVAGCRVPIVFVNGTRDWPTRAHERRFLRLARSAELVLAPGSPHGVSQFAPATFARAIGRGFELAGAP